MVVHHIPRGAVIVVPAGAWRHGEGELRLQIARVLHELNRYQDQLIWVEGTRLAESPRWLQAQVRLDVAHAEPMGSYASHLDLCPPVGSPTAFLAGDATPLVHSVVAWCEAQFGTTYSLTGWRAAAQRTHEHPGGFTAWYGSGKLTPGIQVCPGLAAGTSALRDRPSHNPACRWTFTAWDQAGQRWVAAPVEGLRASMRSAAGPVVALPGTPSPPARPTVAMMIDNATGERVPVPRLG